MYICERLASVLAPHRGEKGALIPVLQKVQKEMGYLSQEVVSEIASFLGLSESEVYGVASFYAQFRFKQPGEHTVKVCEGTACHVGGAARILEEVERELGVKCGNATDDYKFTLERVACVGCCALAPVVVVDKTVCSKMSVAKVKKILAEYQGK